MPMILCFRLPAVRSSLWATQLKPLLDEAATEEEIGVAGEIGVGPSQYPAREKLAGEIGVRPSQYPVMTEKRLKI